MCFIHRCQYSGQSKGCLRFVGKRSGIRFKYNRGKVKDCLNYMWNVQSLIFSPTQTYFCTVFHLKYMNHWGIGWIDWNLVLNRQGGPNWIDNYVDAPIIVNPETDEFFKQPMYYALKHFSRFVERGSVRININNNLSNVKSTAFVTPSNEVVVVLYNK